MMKPISQVLPKFKGTLYIHTKKNYPLSSWGKMTVSLNLKSVFQTFLEKSTKMRPLS